MSLLRNYWINRATSWFLYIFGNFETTGAPGKFGILPLAGRGNPENEIMIALAEKLGGSDSYIGYRKMHRYLRAKWMICRHKDVRVTVNAPESVSLRRRLNRGKQVYKGPYCHLVLVCMYA